jgi:hypothetical protein
VCLFAFFSILVALSQTVSAQLRDENLRQSLLDRYKIDFQTRKGNMLLSEMVPQNESVKNWTEMVTTQIFIGLKSATPRQFRDFMENQWVGTCISGEVASIAEGNQRK